MRGVLYIAQASLVGRWEVPLSVQRCLIQALDQNIQKLIHRYLGVVQGGKHGCLCLVRVINTLFCLLFQLKDQLLDVIKDLVFLLCLCEMLLFTQNWNSHKILSDE